MFLSSKPRRSDIISKLSIFASSQNIPVPKIKINLLRQIDWLSPKLDKYSPTQIGNFLILETKKKDLISRSKTIKIHTNNTFGSGHHESTQGCLLMLQRLKPLEHFSNILDLGCGSGILSLASAKLWNSSVLAIDLDKKAIETTKFNLLNNQLYSATKASYGDGYKSKFIRQYGPFDLIICNLLANLLHKISSDVKKNLISQKDKKGHLILSGLLKRQSRHIIATHRSHGLKLVRSININDWVTLLFVR